MKQELVHFAVIGVGLVAEFTCRWRSLRQSGLTPHAHVALTVDPSLRRPALPAETLRQAVRSGWNIA